MAFSLFYKKKTKELMVFFKDEGRDALCVISIDRHPTAKQKIIGDNDWKPVNPEFESFSFDKAYSYSRDRNAPGSPDDLSYSDHKNVINCFFRQSLRKGDNSLLDHYNFNRFLILLFIRKALIRNLIKSNAALALLLIHDSCNLSLPFESDELWADIRETAQLSPSEIIKKIYNLKAIRKAASILQKTDTRELPDIGPLLQLIDCLRDDCMLRILDNVSKISYEVLLIITERRNRSVINAGFLNSVIASREVPVSAFSMLEWLHTNKIRIHFTHTDVEHLHAVYEEMKKKEVLPQMSTEFNYMPSFCPQKVLEPVNDHEKKKDTPLEVPHKMERASDIMLAMQHDVLGLGEKTYKKLLDFEGKMPIDKPAALLHAKPVSREIYVLKERRITQQLESYKQSRALNSISDSALINAQFPEIEELIDPECLNNYTVPASGETCSNRLRGHAYTLKRDRMLHDHVKGELRSIMHCSQTRIMPHKELKRLITALTLHNNRNTDIVQALKIALANQHPVLRENALAELLFKRIPDYVRSHFANDAKMMISMRQKLLSKLSKISGPANLKIALFHLTPRANTRKKDDFIAMTSRLLSFIEKTAVIDEESKTNARSFIHNMIGEIKRLESMYPSLFLEEKELQDLFALYKPNNSLVTCNMQHVERTIWEHCSSQTLYMYPCKDYLDIEKYRWSGDCSHGSLGMDHFSTPQYFNIRLFRDDKTYCGNIYMLQLEHDSKQYLLIDRIQTTEIYAQYVHFYKSLKDAFLEMFQEFPFHEILLSNSAASNNKSLNEIYHNTKKGFPKVHIPFNLPDKMRSHFESLCNDTFRVLCAKNS